MVRVVAFGNLAGEQRQAEPPDFVKVEVPDRVSELMGRRIWPRNEAVPGEGVENPGIVSVGWIHFVALFRRVSASMRDTHSA